MNRQELIVGHEYVVDHIPGFATYAGIHDGVLVAADGTEFHGAKGSLRFVYEDGDKKRVKLVGDGRAVTESRAAKEAREMLQATRKKNIADARIRAFAAFVAWGLPVQGERDYDPEKLKINPAETLGGCGIQNIQMRHLFQIARCGMPPEFDEDPLHRELEDVHRRRKRGMMPGDDIIQAQNEMNAEWIAWRQVCRELEPKLQRPKSMDQMMREAAFESEPVPFDLNADEFKPLFAAIKRWGERLNELRDAQVMDIVIKARGKAEAEYEQLRTLPDEDA